ncbi:MAG: type II secretion system F family protein [Anaerocolumna aminovalerica]|uniref:type II secretion system F family protein n=1 Tax=Anaerocolumna aminovalerica TaxID=1527 RepID=UPI002906B66A|nr:type II secretion system F family protein [Anaerocolumna aminovalerica]MDU6265971.1 type II secretion system F family protein [Anaerocolumna aminovalerica]
MNSYSYLVINKKGKVQKGSIEAIDEEKAKLLLKAEGFLPVSLEKQSFLNKDINITVGNPVKSRDLSVFCRQFVSILTAEVSVVNALDLLTQQTENKVLSEAIKEVQTSVEKGEGLADAMREQKKVFPSILTNMVKAGEASGDLETVFERLAIHFEKETKLKLQMKKALIYPIIVGLVAVAVLVVMMLFVVPNFMAMFTDMNIDMPFMTRLVIRVSDFMVTRWYVLIVVAACIIIGFSLYKKSTAGRETLGRIAYKVPFYGKFIMKSISARLTRTLCTLLAAGIPVIEALDITARTMDNVVAKDALLLAKEDVAKGIPLSIPIKNAGIFPPMLYQMIKIGEESGDIESMLEKVADYYDEEVEAAAQRLTAVLEPAIIIFLAFVVGIIIMAIMQPMLAMYEGLGNL